MTNLISTNENSAKINGCVNDFRAVARGIESISKELAGESVGTSFEGRLMDIYILSKNLRKSLDELLVD